MKPAAFGLEPLSNCRFGVLGVQSVHCMWSKYFRKVIYTSKEVDMGSQKACSRWTTIICSPNTDDRYKPRKNDTSFYVSSPSACLSRSILLRGPAWAGRNDVSSGANWLSAALVGALVCPAQGPATVWPRHRCSNRSHETCTEREGCTHQSGAIFYEILGECS